MSKNKWKLATNLIHSGSGPDEKTGAVNPPIHSSAAYAYENAQSISDVFAGRAYGHIYSRITNPTVSDLERRLAQIESALGSVFVSSGLAAITGVILSLCESGDELITSHCLFGGTLDLLDETIPKLGIKVNYADASQPDSVRDAITDRTRLIFFEAISNPKLEIPNIKEIVTVANEKNVPVVIDSTMSSPVILQAKELGVHIVIHSSTKYITGNGGAIGGVVTDLGLYKWNTSPSVEIQKSVDKFKHVAFIERVRRHIIHNIGACASPFSAYLAYIGLETMSIRVKQHSKNALALATALEAHPKVKKVNYPGLESHPQHCLAKEQYGALFGGMLTIELASQDAAFQFVNGVKLARSMANLGDTRTMVIHPASTIYLKRPEETTQLAGVTPEMIRVSVGIEDSEDIINDFKAALEGIK